MGRVMFAPSEPKTMSLLFVGEIGAGKSTLINYLANLSFYESIGDFKVVIPTQCKAVNVEGFEEHSEGNLGSLTPSRTTKCEEYRFSKGYINFVFIDTPGFSDDIGADEQNISEIIEVACRQETIDAIVLLINGTSTRISVNIQTTMTRIMGNYPNAFYDNFVVIFTNCDENTCNFDINALPNKPRKVFYVNNTVFREAAENGYLGSSWRNSIETISKFVKFVSSFKPISTQEFLKLRKQREQMKAETIFGFEYIKDLETQLNAYEEAKRSAEKARREAEELQTQAAIDDAVGECEAPQLSEQTVAEVLQNLSLSLSRMQETAFKIKELVSSLSQIRYSKLSLGKCLYEKAYVIHERVETTEYHNTLCQHPECEEPCHERCGLGFNGLTGQPYFNKCQAMQKNGYCKCGHLPTDHFHARYKKANVISKRKKQNPDMIAQMESEEAEIVREEVVLRRLKVTLKQVQKSISVFEDSFQRLQESGQVTQEDVARVEEVKYITERERVEVEEYYLAQYSAFVSAIESQEDSMNQAIQSYKVELETMKRKVCDLFGDTKRLCHFFNFLGELQCQTNKPKVGQCLLTDTESVKEAQKLIRRLTAMLNS